MNLTEEIRDGFLVSKKTKELWCVQLELLHELKRICALLNIRLFASGGTLLGGVRHHGYIPWDDDIDVLLFRDDYEKLLKEGPKYFKSDYFLQSSYSDNIMRSHAQLRKNGTTYFTKNDYRTKYHKGIFIDIFIFDKIPNSKDEVASFKEELLRKWRKINQPRFVRSVDRNIAVLFLLNVVVVLKRIRWFLRNITSISRKKRFAEYEECVKKYNDSNSQYVSNVSFRATIPSCELLPFKLEWFSKPSVIRFEDTDLLGPEDVDSYLTLQYGNYKKYVVGTSFHGNVFFDAKNDYSKYNNLSYKEFMRLFDNK